MQLKQLLHSAPPYSNPYAFASKVLQHDDNPPAPSYTFPIIVFFGVVYALIIICCLVILALPFFQGSANRHKHLWILKRSYTHRSSTPYLIFNNGLVLAITQLAASLFFTVYISFLYKSFKSAEFGKDVNGLAWAEIRWLPGYYGYFVQAWTAFHTWQHQSSSQRKSRTALSSGIHPQIFNGVLIFVPVLVTVVAIFMTVLQSIAVHQSIKTSEYFYEALGAASSLWDTGYRNLTSVEQSVLEQQFLKYQLGGSEALQRTRENVIFWNVSGLPTLVFYIISVWGLLNVIKGILKEVNQSTDSVVLSDESGIQNYTPDCKSTLSVKCQVNSTMKRNHTFLAWHYSVLAITLLFDTAVGAYFTAQDSVQVRKATSRSISVLGSLGGSVPMLVAMLILLFHMATELKEPTSTPTDHHQIIVGDLNYASYIITSRCV
ncbi:hypothetical protein DFH28DRAFT_1107866 [Melampsora americana]|nr:hypothetical protein DFH28DRAFT_1107866 [Melampsora americana]